MKTGKTFIQVFIEGNEENLPEKEGYYFVSSEKYNIPFDIYRWLSGKKVLKRQWLENIDWYLKEVEQPSDEEIEKYFTSQHYDNKNGHHYRINKDRIFGAKAARDGKIK